MGIFALAVIMQFAGYGAGIFFAKRPPDEQD
jgi:hypothetical protein